VRGRHTTRAREPTAVARPRKAGHVLRDRSRGRAVAARLRAGLQLEGASEEADVMVKAHKLSRKATYAFHKIYVLYYFDETRCFFLPARLLRGTGRCSCMDDGLVRSRLENLVVCR
jgi:hypothetical protein